MRQILPVIILLTALGQANAQERDVDSLMQLSYEEFADYFKKQYVDSINDILYGKANLMKAKNDKDTLRMAEAYYRLAISSDFSNSLSYCDSSILITRHLTNHPAFPAKVYNLKGLMYFEAQEYEQALNLYLQALSHSEQSNNTLYSYLIKYNIAMIKEASGDYEESLEMTLDYVSYLNNSDLERKDFFLSTALYTLANSYIKTNKLDSAKNVIETGYEKSVQLKDTLLTAYFTYLSGMYLYERGEYEQAIDTLSSTAEFFNESDLFSSENLYLYNKSNLYLGKSYWKLEEKELAIVHLKKIDDFLQQNKNVEKDLLSAYKPIIEYYKEKADLTQELKYINRYIRADSIFDKQYTFLTKKITSEFEMPNILNERNKVIDQLQQRKSTSDSYIYALLVLALLLILTIAFYVRKSAINKKRFQALLAKLENGKIETEIPKRVNEGIESAVLSSEVTEEILRKLEEFEKKEGFIKSCTLASLSKEFKTNSTYLSKVINAYKGNNFATYLSQLRINYVINKLRNEEKFRLYTVEAIANEIGFNTAQSFSKAFSKQTGLKPSYFIKNLTVNKL